MASAAGSGDEPGYEQANEVQNESYGGVTLGLAGRDNPFSGERWSDEEELRPGRNRREGDRTPEQQAADLLESAEAAEGAEPDYDFASVEGGNGSPDQGEVTVSADRSRVATLDGAVPRRSEGVVPASEGTSAHRDAGFFRITATGGAALLRGPHSGEGQQMQASPGHINGVGGHTRSGGGDATMNWWETGEAVYHGRSARPAASESTRTEVLEALVHQLMEQNEHLRNEVAESRSRTSGESGRDRFESVQGERSVVEEGMFRCQSKEAFQSNLLQPRMFPMIGTVATNGDVIINSESPKYFALQDGDVQDAAPPPPPPVPAGIRATGGKRASGQCFPSDARWNEILNQARLEYDKWSKAKPLDRAKILGKPKGSLLQEPFVRIESRGVAMLSKALPSVVYEQALANRNVTCVGLIFLTLRTYQPGGLNERAELLRGLTNLAPFDSAMIGVSGLQKWFRHLERAKSMGISVPDSSLLLDSLDKALTGLLQGNPSMNFRMHSVRMQLQLDTRPQLETVEEFARTVLSELELLSVAMPDNEGKETSQQRPLQKGSQPRADCVAPGGGKYQKPQGTEPGNKGKGKSGSADGGSGGKGKNGAASKASAPQPTGLSPDAIKEAAQLLQSMRLAALKPYVRTATELLCRAHRGEPRGLIDGGATSCLRTAEAHEQDMPVVGVKLAFGECQLLVNPQGTLLSRTHVSPILSVRALLSLGFKIEWDSSKCRIWHPCRGELDLDSSSGCPEISEQEALVLIKEYESLMERNEHRSARLHCIMKDLEALGLDDLACIIVQRDAHADAAMQTLLTRIFPGIDRELLSQATVSLQDQVRSVDAGFLEHLKNNHTPYRRDRDPTITVESFAKGLEDREWFINQGMELEEPMPEPSQRELKEARDAWSGWEKVVKASREDWLREAKAEYLPRVEMVDMLFTEAVETKKQQEVTAAVSRMYAKAISDGYDVRRVHTDRGREFNNAALKAFCSKFALHQTFALAEEHQTNGRAEGAILRIKSKTRAILQAAGGGDLKEWPLAAKLAAHQLRGVARARLKLPAEPYMARHTDEPFAGIGVDGTRQLANGTVLQGKVFQYKSHENSLANQLLGPSTGGERDADSVLELGHEGEQMPMMQNSRTALSPAPVSTWGARYAARCDDLVDEWDKGIEVVSGGASKVTVCEVCKFVPGDVFEDESDKEPLPYEVPTVSREMHICPVFQGAQNAKCLLERVAWPMKGSLETCAFDLAANHQARCKMLEALGGDGDCWLRGIESEWLIEVQHLERELRAMQGYELRALQRLEDASQGSEPHPSLRAFEVEENPLSQDQPGQEMCSGNGAEPSDPEDVAPLQSKIISQEQVRREMPKWCGPLKEEYDNLTKDSGTVKPLTDQEFSELLNDTSIALELIPGKGVYVHKSTGRRRARIVCCGNHQSGESHPKSELFASGIGGEGIRMLVRKAAMRQDWNVATADVKAAFLQAPVIAGHSGGKPRVIVVKVPHILRASGVCSERYWLVQKAMYGLAVSPKCWVTHRNKVLRDLKIPFQGGVVRCVPMMEDANMWKLEWDAEAPHAVPEEGIPNGMLGLLGLYVDDILTTGPPKLLEAVLESLQSAWQLSTPEYLSSPGDTVKFSGFQVEKTGSGYLLHQTSYVMDLLDQYRDDIQGEETTPASKTYEVSELDDGDEKHKVTKRAQTLVGQLLWVSNRTRPDLAFGVSMAGQKIASHPAESLARAEHLIRYLRYAPRMGLHYGPAGGRCGKWNQLKYQEVEASVDVFTDASFCADEQSRSFGSIQLFWAGALIAWSSSRQTLIASHTAESELYSLAEGHLLGKAMRPTIAALLDLPAEIETGLETGEHVSANQAQSEGLDWELSPRAEEALLRRYAETYEDNGSGLWDLPGPVD
ncbi:RE1, partial [Symbiodinium sp. CCMP2456]